MEHLLAGNVKAAMKDAGAVSADLWQVEPSKLRVLPGFNVRERTEAYTARVRAIADSIKENGYYKDKPLSGFVATDGIYITGGHRRHEAVLLAISEGCPVAAVPVVVSPKGTSVEDLTVALVTGNDGEPLTLYEAAVVCKRLAGFGWDSATIARRLGYASAQYVDGLLSLAGAPLAVRSMVIAGAVSATTAIAALGKHGAAAADVLQAALTRAAGGRVTAKHMPQDARQTAVRKYAAPLHEALDRVTKDSSFALMSDDLRAVIIELLAKI